MQPNQNYPRLFSKLALGKVQLKNRLVHAAISTGFTRDGSIADDLINYCSNRASGGAAAIILEPTNMHAGQTDPRRPDVFNGANQSALKRLVASVEWHDCRLLAQVQDAGRGRRESGRNESAIGASALADDLSWTVPHVLSVSDIGYLVDDFSISCSLLQAAGFTGVEISAGHGHLFHQFMSPWSNHRTDAYGGNLAGRTLLIRELISAIRAATGGDFLIGIKLPGADSVVGSIDPQGAQAIADTIGATGDIDYWSFCKGSHANSLFEHLPTAHGERAPYLREITRLRQAAPQIPTGALGYITDPNEAERALEQGFDLVMLGRAMITDPAWGLKAQQGREAAIRYCVSCNTCWRTLIESGRLACDNNPRVGQPHEADWWPAVQSDKKRVVVVGSGIAGMEAAWVASARGHAVTVLGQGAQVGGKTRLHAQLPGGENLSSIYDYQALAARRAEVALVLGEVADITTIEAYEPDVVILATGSHMSWPLFLDDTFRDTGFFLDLRQFLVDFKVRVHRQAGRLVIYDKDHTEMTYACAEFFSMYFDEVILITPRERIASDVSLVSRQGIYQRLFTKGVRIITSSEPCWDSDFEAGQLTCENIYNHQRTKIDQITALTFATPRIPNDALLAPLLLRGFEVRTIGDCYAPRSVLAATREGHEAGISL
tara:strand:+ start:4246 stop:6228 length:1983 start_codon:yes stop_codon:yes gene_type:complete